MKKFFTTALTLAICFALNSCGFMGGGNSVTNTVNAVNNASQATSALGGILSQLLAGATTNEKSIVGKWTYSSPKIVFESENILAKLGSSVMSNKVEAKFEEYLEKTGFKKGSTSITFNEDKTCSMTVGERTLPGTYSFDPTSKQMIITGALGMNSVTCTVYTSGNELHLLFDANRVLNIMNNLSSYSQKTSSLSSILSNYSGLKLGWTLTR